ncbi:angiopoietin-related protein 4-like [Genypterus blacodes]|uniref:angiopoietin-related protein 4-like n=1 Tax=Genypterus blacodes TaxID=154954 RepID=UPI003F75C75D
MRLPLLLLLLVIILAQVGTGFPSDRSRSKQASWDDVNVVAHGLLQLGQGLKEHVDKIKGQMRDVNTKLKVFNVTVTELVRNQQEQDEALKTRGEEAVEEAVRAKVEEEVKKENEIIHSRMDRLEAMLGKAISEPKVESNFSDGPGVPFIQRIVEAQNRRIDELVEKIQQQQDKLEKQSLQSKKRVKSHRRRDEETTLKGEAEHEATTGVGRDCHDLFVQGQRVSGVYTIQPENSRPFNVLCEMTPEGGWTVIQKRHDGSQNFNQLWESYQRGFGSLNGEFWLGLENIHSLSKQGRYLLQVEISDWSDQQKTAQYQFQLDGEEAMYALHLEQVPSSGDLVEAVNTGASGLPFSTSDRDNDLNKDFNCAELLSGGWWFSSCGDSNLNGKYPRRPSVMRRHNRMFWTTNRLKASLKKTVMKIAPATTKS